MSELLPCPFCGGTKQFVITPTCKESDPYDPADLAVPIVRCCGCFTDVPGKNWDHSGKSAIDRWNTRATTPTASELVEALRSSMALIDRLMHVHVAPDECTSYVEQSRQWFYDNGGTLAALADQQAANRAALSNIGEE